MPVVSPVVVRRLIVSPVPMSLRKRSYPSPLFRLMTKKLESGDILNPRLKSRPSVSSTLPKPLADWPLRAATAAERTVNTQLDGLWEVRIIHMAVLPSLETASPSPPMPPGIARLRVNAASFPSETVRLKGALAVSNVIYE